MIRHAFRLQIPDLDDTTCAISSLQYDGIAPPLRFGMDRTIDLSTLRLMKSVETEMLDGHPCHVERLCCSEASQRDSWIPYKLRYTHKGRKIDILFFAGLTWIYNALVFEHHVQVRDPMEVLLERHGVLDDFRKQLRDLRDVFLFSLGADADLSEEVPYQITHLYEDFLSHKPEGIGPEEVRILMSHLSQDRAHHFKWIDPWTAMAIEEGPRPFHPRQVTTRIDQLLLTPKRNSVPVSCEDFNRPEFSALLKAIQPLPCTDFHISFFLRHVDSVDTHRLDLPFPRGGVFQDRYRPGHVFQPEETLGWETTLMNAVTSDHRFTETMLSVHGDDLILTLTGTFDERIVLTVSRDEETLRTFLWDRAILSLFPSTVVVEETVREKTVDRWTG